MTPADQTDQRNSFEHQIYGDQQLMQVYKSSTKCNLHSFNSNEREMVFRPVPLTK